MPDDSPTTVAILTPTGRGAVAVIAIDGPQAAELVDRFFQAPGAPTFRDRAIDQIVYGRWGEKPAEDVIACRRGTLQVEIHCHGGSAAAQRIVGDLASAGAMVQAWTDWIAQHETSPLRAAARTALAHATTERTVTILLDQYHGSLEAALRRAISHLDAADPNSAATELAQLLARASLGLHLTQPWRVVIAGPPNVGKSSLLNALLGYRRAIVFDQPGTTRDVVSATTALDGWPVQLSDTAGWRTTDELLEAAGADRAAQQAAAADCLLLVFDISLPWTAAQQQLVDAWPAAIVVGNKSDLSPSHPIPAKLLTSALTGAGLEQLIQAISARLIPHTLSPGEAVPFTQSQIDLVGQASEAIEAANPSQARSHLLSLLANS